METDPALAMMCRRLEQFEEQCLLTDEAEEKRRLRKQGVRLQAEARVLYQTISTLETCYEVSHVQ